jgi:hypothetical protein
MGVPHLREIHRNIFKDVKDSSRENQTILAPAIYQQLTTTSPSKTTLFSTVFRKTPCKNALPPLQKKISQIPLTNRPAEPHFFELGYYSNNPMS